MRFGHKTGARHSYKGENGVPAIYNVRKERRF